MQQYKRLVLYFPKDLERRDRRQIKNKTKIQTNSNNSHHNKQEDQTQGKKNNKHNGYQIIKVISQLCLLTVQPSKTEFSLFLSTVQWTSYLLECQQFALLFCVPSGSLFILQLSTIFAEPETFQDPYKTRGETVKMGISMSLRIAEQLTLQVLQ